MVKENGTTNHISSTGETIDTTVQKPFLYLPLEIIQLILAYFQHDKASLRALCLINRKWHTECLRFLYPSVKIRDQVSHERWKTMLISSAKYRHRWHHELNRPRIEFPGDYIHTLIFGGSVGWLMDKELRILLQCIKASQLLHSHMVQESMNLLSPLQNIPELENMTTLIFVNAWKLKNMAGILYALPNLKVFCFSGGSKHAEQSIVTFLNTLGQSRLPYLTHLDLQVIHMYPITLHLGNYPSLRTFIFRRHSVSRSTNRRGDKVSFQCPRLHTLDLSGWPWTLDSFKIFLLSCSRRCLYNIRILQLRHCKKLNAGILPLIRKYMPRLQQICVKSIQLDEKDLLKERARYPFQIFVE